MNTITAFSFFNILIIIPRSIKTINFLFKKNKQYD